MVLLNYLSTKNILIFCTKDKIFCWLIYYIHSPILFFHFLFFSFFTLSAPTGFCLFSPCSHPLIFAQVFHHILLSFLTFSFLVIKTTVSNLTTFLDKNLAAGFQLLLSSVMSVFIFLKQFFKFLLNNEADIFLCYL